MALTLAQANAASREQLAAGVGQVFVSNSFILDRLAFENIEGTAYKYFTESALPGAEFRAVNASYAESTGTVTSATEGLVILGGDADVDRFLQLTRSDLIDQRATQVEMKARAIAHKFNDTFINGNTGVDANSFNGLKQRLTSGQLLSTGTNGAAINTDTATRQNFFDNLDALIGQVPNCDVLLTNRQILSKYRSAARRETMAQTTVDGLGRTVDVYNGIPIVDVGNKADGTQIIPQTETQGTASGISGSIYAVHFGAGAPEQGVVGLTNGGVQVFDLGQLETKPVFRTRIEWFTGLALFGAQPAARLQGVLAS
jgi:hypothetical protein